MPFPQDLPFYDAMHTQADVISAAIDSLDVQVAWGGTRIVGAKPEELSQIDPLIAALAEYGELADALQVFTKEIFCFGNVSIIVHENGAKVWRPDWRLHQDYVDAAREVKVLEARRPPVDAQGFGTPVLEQGLTPFKAYLKVQNDHIQELKRYAAHPVGAPPTRARTDLAALNAVLKALGFAPWDPEGDVPRFLGAGAMQNEVKDLFVHQILRPFAAIVGVGGTLSLAP